MSGKPFKRYNKKPRLRVHMIENVNHALAFMKEEKLTYGVLFKAHALHNKEYACTHTRTHTEQTRNTHATHTQHTRTL